jgi:hypothetical protein
MHVLIPSFTEWAFPETALGNQGMALGKRLYPSYIKQQEKRVPYF